MRKYGREGEQKRIEKRREKKNRKGEREGRKEFEEIKLEERTKNRKGISC